ncbi:hypothetical protein LTS18_003410 [Coniosporium uncinatum]|uniref:Uncharacterized protein n=1 Tax=Coniosporium uncinatum TaxID=93489 RepID=A0ACC3DTM3_9PEZI|nr:hypothetical protein LTS18_003410 [Coniosporium uncinatum]
MSGVGVEYNANVLNPPLRLPLGRNYSGLLKSGCLLPPATISRYIDANPVHVTLDIPMLGQFRVFFITTDLERSMPLLKDMCAHLVSSASVLGRATAKAQKSYAGKPASKVPMDEFDIPGRYTAVSDICTFALLTSTAKDDFELVDLPPVLSQSRWSVYLDDVMQTDAHGNGMSCIGKWMGVESLKPDEVAVVSVRPDGYVGAVGLFGNAEAGAARSWMDEYFGGFLDDDFVAEGLKVASKL